MPSSRPDLSNRSIVFLLLVSVLAAVVILIIPTTNTPGSPRGQIAASVGSVLLLAPVLFSLMKRSGFSASPPTWFVVHVLATLTGGCFIVIHVRSADWLSPPGFVFFLLVFLILQGCFLRVLLSQRFSLLFARNSTQQGFVRLQKNNKEALRDVIDQKVELLKLIDGDAQEALFSPTLSHWLRHPVLSFRYQRLAESEATLVGARSSAGKLLSWARRIHMLAAALFFVGLFAHVIVVLFFAGYAAGSGEISWWYVTDWGKQQ